MADADFVVPVGVPDIKYVNFHFLFFFLPDSQQHLYLT